MNDERKQRTAQQNRALHLYFRLVADRLNGAGLDMRTTLAPDVEIAWTKEMVKEYLWRPLQEIQLQKRSTTELETKDIDVIYATVNEFLAKHGLHEEFPSLESLIEAERNRGIDEVEINAKSMGGF